MHWDEYFINEAYLAAQKSKDKRSQVGACIVGQDREIIAKGYNGPCRGMNDENPKLHEKPGKAFFFEHAERNAIFNAARIGTSLKGAKLYTTCFPCADCARAIIQSGIEEVIVHAESPEMQGYKNSADAARQMFRECDVEVRTFSCEPIIPSVRRGGKDVPLSRKEQWAKFKTDSKLDPPEQTSLFDAFNPLPKVSVEFQGAIKTSHLAYLIDQTVTSSAQTSE